MNLGLFPSGGESEPGMETYYFEFPIGAAGAVGTAVRSRGFSKTAPFTRSSAGVYVFALEDGVFAICDWNFDLVTASPTTGGAWPRVTARTTNAAGYYTSITVTVMNAAGAAATDPNNGDIFVGSVTVKNSNA